MQGRLRHEKISVEIETRCAYCGQELHLILDSELKWSIKETGAVPLLFVPEVDWGHFEGSNIIHDY